MPRKAGPIGGSSTFARDTADEDAAAGVNPAGAAGRAKGRSTIAAIMSKGNGGLKKVGDPTLRDMSRAASLGYVAGRDTILGQHD